MTRPSPRRWGRPGCAEAARSAPSPTWIARSRRSAAARRPSSPWSSFGWGGRRGVPTAGEPTLVYGRALAERAQATAGTLPAHRALGTLWLALGTARLRRWELTDARRELGHAVGQLEAAGPAGLLDRARGWQALAEALYGDLRAAAEIIALEELVPADPDAAG